MLALQCFSIVWVVPFTTSMRAFLAFLCVFAAAAAASSHLVYRSATGAVPSYTWWSRCPWDFLFLLSASLGPMWHVAVSPLVACFL